MSAAFASPTRAEWEASATRALKGAPLSGLSWSDADGHVVAPLYSADDGVVALSTPRASDADGRAWDLRTRVEGDDPTAVNAAVLADLEGGAASVVLAGVVTRDADPLGRALANVALELAPVGLDAGIDGPDAANALAIVAKGSPRARLMFNLDPVSAWATAGGSPRPIDDHLTLAANTAARHAGAYPEAMLSMASGRCVHEAGGSPGQELGFVAASALAHVRAALMAGMTAERATAGIALGLSVDAEYFEGLAKVRALRLIWRTMMQTMDLSHPATIEVRSSRRMLSARDPWPNLLRLTAAGFAGAVGGADAVVLDGFTAAAGHPDAFARRQARNAQLVLMEEAHLGDVADPAAGSWFLDTRSRDMARAGWSEFQRIESEGGLVASLKAGRVQARVAEARQGLEAAMHDGRTHRIGVTRFVDPDVRPASVEAVNPAVETVSASDVCAPLTPFRLAAPFEVEGDGGIAR